MKMSAYFKHMRIMALIEWIPRAANKEADSLANGVTTGFDPALEVKMDDAVLTWLVLPDVLVMGRAADEIFQDAKRKGSSRIEGRSRGNDALRRGCVLRILGETDRMS